MNQKEEEKLESDKGVMSQFDILESMGVPKEEIPKFQDATHWLHYFPPMAKTDLKRLGIMTDWRRSFITTEVNPFYNRFIEWQFNTLHKNGYLSFGKRHSVFSAMDGQPCADHDRAKGEGVGPQEYTIVKLEVLEMPERLRNQFEGKKVFLAPATLRPETMYGQTNCFVLPEGKYGIFETLVENEYFVISERAARNLSYQNMTKEFGKFSKVADVTGQELIGCPLKAPLSSYEKVYCLPMPTISMGKGTGVVTSVPSDSPDDYAMMRDLQTKKGLREKYNV